MAAMRTEELREIDKLGPIGIVKEAFQIFRTHAKVFLLIQLAFMADLVALSLVARYFLFKNLPGINNPDPKPPPQGSPALFSHHHHRHFPQKFEYFFGTTSPIPMVLTVLAISSAVGVVYNGFMCLSLSATIYSVGLHYAGRAVSFLDVIRAAVPRLWMRLGVTSTYAILVVDFLVLVETVGILLILNNYFSTVAVLATNVLVWLLVVLVFGLNLIFSVAHGVSVFENDYGWAAMRKGLKLLKGKIIVAILLQLLLIVPVSIVQACAVLAFENGMAPVDLRPWQGLLAKVLTVVVYIFWTTFVLQFFALCDAVQYVSFKAHHESVSFLDCIYQKQTDKVGYQRIGNETDEPLLLGQEVGSSA